MCPLLRGFQCIEVYGDTIQTVTSVRYIVGVRHRGVSVKRGSTVLDILLILLSHTCTLLWRIPKNAGNTYLTLPSSSLGKAPASRAEDTDFESSLGKNFLDTYIIPLVSNPGLE